MALETTRQSDSNGVSQSGGAVIEVRCPADGRIVGHAPDLGPAGVAAAAKQLRAAQPAWEALGPDGRAKHMRNFLNWILDNEDHLVGIMQEESGKSWGDAALEISMAVDLINYYSRACRRIPRRPQGRQLGGRRADQEAAGVRPALSAGRHDHAVERPAGWTRCSTGWRP